MEKLTNQALRIASASIMVIGFLTFIGHDFFNLTGAEQPPFPMNILYWLIPVAKLSFICIAGYVVYKLGKLHNHIVDLKNENEQLQNLSREALIKSHLYPNIQWGFDGNGMNLYKCSYKRLHKMETVLLKEGDIEKLMESLKKTYDQKGSIGKDDMKLLELNLVDDFRKPDPSPIEVI